MDILVVGAGSIGGLLAARLALAGHDVAVVARGAHFAAIDARGALSLETRDGTLSAPVRAYDTVEAAPRCSVIVVTLKGHQLDAVVDGLADKAKTAACFMPIQNGIPWWYFQGTSGARANRVVRAVDPHGKLAARLGDTVLVPAFATVAAEVTVPGNVVHQAFDADAFPLGALHEHHGDAAERAAALIRSAGFSAPLTDARRFVWIKLLGNIWANPVGALTGRSVAEIATHPASRPLALALMRETDAVARAYGIDPGIDFEQRLERAQRLRQGVKSSMLQDIERGRQTEHRAIVGALVELADDAGVDVPHVRTLDACMELKQAKVSPSG